SGLGGYGLRTEQRLAGTPVPARGALLGYQPGTGGTDGASPGDGAGGRRRHGPVLRALPSGPVLCRLLRRNRRQTVVADEPRPDAHRPRGPERLMNDGFFVVLFWPA